MKRLVISALLVFAVGSSFFWEEELAHAATAKTMWRLVQDGAVDDDSWVGSGRTLVQVAGCDEGDIVTTPAAGCNQSNSKTLTKADMVALGPGHKTPQYYITTGSLAADAADYYAGVRFVTVTADDPECCVSSSDYTTIVTCNGDPGRIQIRRMILTWSDEY